MSRETYPAGGLTKLGDTAPMGTTMLTPAIETDARSRMTTIRRDLDHAGPHYPREQVKSVMAYWNIEL